jgi:hypothetical protein
VAIEGVGRSTGVRGQSFIGPGVNGVGGSVGVTGTGEVFGVNGTVNTSSPGAAGVKAENTGGGLALLVSGKVQFSSSGSGTIKQMQNSTAVPSTAITSRSHVLLTLTSNPDSRARIHWVEITPGSGFTVHLTSNVHADTSFRYLIVELPLAD